MAAPAPAPARRRGTRPAQHLRHTIGIGLLKLFVEAGVLALGRSRNSCRLNSAASKSRGDAQGSSVSGRCRGSSTSWFIDSLAGSDPRRIVSIGAARRPGGTPVIAWRPAESRSSYLQSSSVAQQPQQPSKRHE